MSTNSVVEHRANYYFVKLCEEYVALCEGNNCQALILSVMEEWTNTKKGNGQNLYIYMTYPQWVASLYGAHRRNTIIAALADLEERKLISKRPRRLHGKDTFEYLLNIKLLNEKLKELPEKKPEDILPNPETFKNRRVLKQTRPKTDGKSKKAVLNRTAKAFEIGRNVDSITQNTNNIESREKSATPSTSQKQPALSSSFSSLNLLKQKREPYYQAYDAFYQKQDGYKPDFKLPRTRKNDEIIDEQIEAGITPEEAVFVLGDIWNDPDPWWKQHRTPSAVTSQYAVRIGKMKTAQKQNLSSKDAPSFLETVITSVFDEIHAPEQDRSMMMNSIQLNYLEHTPKMGEAYFKHIVSCIMDTVRQKYTGDALYGDDAWSDIFEPLSTQIKALKNLSDLDWNNREKRLKYGAPTYETLAKTPVW